MLNRVVVPKSSQVLALQKRLFGSFEQFNPIPPRYFLVKYELDQRQLREKIIEAPNAQLAIEHRDKVQRAVDAQKIVFRGELLPERAQDKEGLDAAAADTTTTVAEASDLDEIFFVFNVRDERELMTFVKQDPLYNEGVVKSWKIEELDLIHKERDDELAITGKF